MYLIYNIESVIIVFNNVYVHQQCERVFISTFLTEHSKYDASVLFGTQSKLVYFAYNKHIMMR